MSLTNNDDYLHRSFKDGPELQIHFENHASKNWGEEQVEQTNLCHSTSIFGQKGSLADLPKATKRLRSHQIQPPQKRTKLSQEQTYNNDTNSPKDTGRMSTPIKKKKMLEGPSTLPATNGANGLSTGRASMNHKKRKAQQNFNSSHGWIVESILVSYPEETEKGSTILKQNLIIKVTWAGTPIKYQHLSEALQKLIRDVKKLGPLKKQLEKLKDLLPKVKKDFGERCEGWVFDCQLDINRKLKSSETPFKAFWGPTKESYHNLSTEWQEEVQRRVENDGYRLQDGKKHPKGFGNAGCKAAIKEEESLNGPRHTDPTKVVIKEKILNAPCFIDFINAVNGLKDTGSKSNGWVAETISFHYPMPEGSIVEDKTVNVNLTWGDMSIKYPGLRQKLQCDIRAALELKNKESTLKQLQNLARDVEKGCKRKAQAWSFNCILDHDIEDLEKDHTPFFLRLKEPQTKVKVWDMPLHIQEEISRKIKEDGYEYKITKPN